MSSCKEQEETLNIYNWAESIDPEIIAEFQKQTGIKVNYDIFDNNDVLEAKLLTGNSGYDIVFPSSYPYLSRQIKADVYDKIDTRKLPNYGLIDKKFTDLLNGIEGGNAYAIPYLWSYTVIAYRGDLVEKTLSEKIKPSSKLLYDIDTLKRVHKCGVGLLEEAIDVLPPILKYLDFPPETSNEDDMVILSFHLSKMRPYIRQMSTIQSAEDMISGDMCVVQNWLGFILELKDRAGHLANAQEIKFFIPEEGTAMWMDVIAIPKDAPNKENAYKFINFLLKPENMARVTNKTWNFNTVPSSQQFLKPILHKQYTSALENWDKLYQPKISDTAHLRQLSKSLRHLKTSN